MGITVWYRHVIRIVVVDDHPSVRGALRLRLELERDVTVVGEAQNGVEAVDVVTALQSDVVLMDVEMPHMDGLAATRALAMRAPRVRGRYDQHQRRCGP